jgi:hypothetical protein
LIESPGLADGHTPAYYLGRGRRMMRLIQFLFKREKRGAPLQTPHRRPLTREEYLRGSENDPMFEEITADEPWAIVVGAAAPPKPEPLEPPKTDQGGFVEKLFNVIIGIAALAFLILVVAYLIFANVGTDIRGWVFFGILFIVAAILTIHYHVGQ